MYLSRHPHRRLTLRESNPDAGRIRHPPRAAHHYEQLVHARLVPAQHPARLAPRDMHAHLPHSGQLRELRHLYAAAAVPVTV